MLRIWTNASLEGEALEMLKAGVGNNTLIIDPEPVANLGYGGPSPSLEGADVAFGQPDPDQALSLQNLKWVHITSAGYTRYDREDFKQAFKEQGRQFSNSSGLFDEPCAQHVLAFMMANARQLPAAFEHQLCDQSWPTAPLRSRSTLLRDQNVLLVGYGAIARRIAELLSPFRLTIKALRRSVKGDESVPTFPIDQLAELLPEADHVVNVLPLNNTTDGLFNQTAFSLMKPGAVFYNIGRGATVEQISLMGALESGRLSAAYLDVTRPEPLPPTDPLWKVPNCVITPHSAGGFAGEEIGMVEHFLVNLRRYEAGVPLADKVF